MPEPSPDLSFIREAASARRRVRRDLRATSKIVAADLVEVLRVGDRVVLEGNDDEVTYAVTKLTWQVSARGDEEGRVHNAPFAESALVRKQGARICSLTDVRSEYEDEFGVTMEPAGREMFTVEDSLVSAWTSVSLATDYEIIMFAMESAQVAQAFSKNLSAELDIMRSAIEGFRLFKGEKV